MVDDASSEILPIGENVQSRIMEIAYESLRKAKVKTTHVPLRVIRHFPKFEGILRPLDFDIVTVLTADIVQNGYRHNEPVLTTPPIPELGLPRFVLGGNHRTAAARNAGLVLIPSFIIDSKSINKIVALTENVEGEEDNITPTEARLNRVLRCLNLLIVATQAKETSPRLPTTLQMVSVIRAYVRNDPELKNWESRGNYGGLKILRSRMFPRIPLQKGNGVHFLLNSDYCNRTLNKCLRGSYILIETKLNVSIQYLEEVDTLLDLLLYWEERALMPPFLISHLFSIGGAKMPRILEIMDKAVDDIYKSCRSDENPCLPYAPFQACNQERRPAKRKESDKTTRDKKELAQDGGRKKQIGDENKSDEEDTISQGNEEEVVEGGTLRRSQRKRKQVDTYTNALQMNGKKRKGATSGNTSGKGGKKAGVVFPTGSAEARKRILELEGELQAMRMKEKEWQDAEQPKRDGKSSDWATLAMDERIKVEDLQQRLSVSQDQEKKVQKKLDSLAREKDSQLEDLKMQLEKRSTLAEEEKPAVEVIGKKEREDITERIRSEVEEKLKAEQAEAVERLVSEKLRLEKEKFRKEQMESNPVPSSEPSEIDKLRKENEELKQKISLSTGQTEDSGQENTGRERSRIQRVPALSDHSLRRMSEKQLQSLISRAQRIITSNSFSG